MSSDLNLGDANQFFDRIIRQRLEYPIVVNQPLVLISQAVRSGGTLLSRLFDSHPELHTYAFELHIGFPESHNWPSFDLDEPNPDVWFQQLYHRSLHIMAHKGHRASHIDEMLPFFHIPPFQRDIFEAQLLGKITSQRQILDAYMTSYFNAWLDNHNLYTGPKKYVSGFVPRLSSNIDSVRHFFEDYPDGRFISIVRDPRDWFVSARHHIADPRWHASSTARPENGWPLIESVQEGWIAAAKATLTLASEYPEQTAIIRFEELLRQPEHMMRALSDWLDIDFTAVLLTPTFNTMPIVSNSTYGMRAFGVSSEPVGRYKTELTGEEIKRMGELTLTLQRQIDAYTLN